MTIPRGFGSFDPTITTKFGPTGTEEIDALNRGVQLGMQQGQQVAKTIMMARREKADIEARKQLEETRAATRYKLYKEQEQGLIFPPIKDIDGISAARAEVSTILVDKANKLFEAKEAGEITAKDYRKGMALLESQIPMYKVAEETIRVNAEKYLAGQANGTLSNTNDPKVESWWAAVADGSAKLQYKTTEAGQIVITGEWDDPNDDIKGKVQVPVSEIERMSVVRYQPKEEVSTFKKANTDSMLTAKIQNSIANGTSKADLLNDLRNSETSNLMIKPNDENMRAQFGNNFDEYMEGLGEGDDVQQVAQYIMDGGKGNYLSSQKVVQDVIDNMKIQDPDLKAKFEDMKTEDDLKELIRLGKLDEVKEGLKNQYIDSSINQYNFDLTEKIKELNNVAQKERRDELKIQSDISTLEDAATDKKSFGIFQDKLLNIRKDFNSWKGEKKAAAASGPDDMEEKFTYNRNEDAQIKYLKDKYKEALVTFEPKMEENAYYKTSEGKKILEQARIDANSKPPIKSTYTNMINKYGPIMKETNKYDVFHAGKLVHSIPKKDLFTKRFDQFLITNIPKSRTGKTTFDVTNLDENSYKKDADKDLKVF
jgi:hypothetical protein